MSVHEVETFWSRHRAANVRVMEDCRIDAPAGGFDV